MSNIISRGFQAYKILKRYETQASEAYRGFEDKFSALDFLRDFMHDHNNMTTLRGLLSEGCFFADFSKLSDHDVIEQLAGQMVSGHIKIASYIVSKLAIQTGGGILLAAEAEEQVESHPPADDVAAETEILEFVLSSESTGHILPFHKFKVFDKDDREIATGETDEMGEATLEVEKSGDYYVVVDSEETYSVSGTVFIWDGVTPLSNSSIEVLPWEEQAFSVETQDKGKLDLREIPMGELLMKYQGSTLSIYIDGNISNGSFYIPYEESEKTEDRVVDYEPLEIESLEEIEINPEDY